MRWMPLATQDTKKGEQRGLMQNKVQVALMAMPGGEVAMAMMDMEMEMAMEMGRTCLGGETADQEEIL